MHVSYYTLVWCYIKEATEIHGRWWWCMFYLRRWNCQTKESCCPNQYCFWSTACSFWSSDQDHRCKTKMSHYGMWFMHKAALDNWEPQPRREKFLSFLLEPYVTNVVLWGGRKPICLEYQTAWLNKPYERFFFSENSFRREEAQYFQPPEISGFLWAHTVNVLANISVLHAFTREVY